MSANTIYYCLILTFFILNYVYAESEPAEPEYSTAESWWSALTSGISNVLPWNWYDNSESKLILKLMETNADINKNQSSASENYPENVEKIPFFKFVKEVNAEMASEGPEGQEKFKGIIESVRNAILDNKLYTYVTLGGKTLLVNLGIIGSQERTKNLEQVSVLLQMLQWILQMLFFWLPGNMQASLHLTPTAPNHEFSLNQHELSLPNKNLNSLNSVILTPPKLNSGITVPQSSLSLNLGSNNPEHSNSHNTDVNEYLKYIIAELMTPMKKNGQIDTDFNINLINDENELKNKYEIVLARLKDLNSAYVGLGLVNKLDMDIAKSIKLERSKLLQILLELATKIKLPEKNDLYIDMKKEIATINDIFDTDNTELSISKIDDKIRNLQNKLDVDRDLKNKLGVIKEYWNIKYPKTSLIQETEIPTLQKLTTYPVSCPFGERCPIHSNYSGRKSIIYS